MRVALLVAVLVSVIAMEGLAAEPEPGCDVSVSRRRNPDAPWFRTWIFQPKGDRESVLGGRCDDARRPGILFAHGYLMVHPAFYGDWIEHLVRRGHSVVYPAYSPIWWPSRQYAMVDAGFRDAVDSTPRIDSSRMAIVGHSFGAGMVPWLARVAAERGWGSTTFVAAAVTPHYANRIGDGPIDLPQHAHLLVFGASGDRILDNRIGIELFRATSLPRHRKSYGIARGPDGETPGHLFPIQSLGFSPPRPVETEVLWPAVDALVACGSGPCVVRFTEAGGSDQRAEDVGPWSLQECGFFLNPRSCLAPAAPASH